MEVDTANVKSDCQLIMIFDYISCVSQVKKIIEKQFDNLPFHGLGKDYSSNWWKSLGFQLISFGMQYIFFYLDFSAKHSY